MGVFVVTSIASLFAYIWLYLVLEIITPNEVDLMEAWLTLVYFFALIFIAFAADKYNEYLEDSRKTQQEQEEKNKKTELGIKKNALRRYKDQYT